MSRRNPPVVAQQYRWLRGSPLVMIVAWTLALGAFVAIGLSGADLSMVVILCSTVVLTLMVTMSLLVHRNLARSLAGISSARTELRDAQRILGGSIARTVSRVEACEKSGRKGLMALGEAGSDAFEAVHEELRVLKVIGEQNIARGRVSAGEALALEAALFDLLGNETTAVTAKIGTGTQDEPY